MTSLAQIRFFFFWILAGFLEYPFIISFCIGPYEVLENNPVTVFLLHGMATLLIGISIPSYFGWLLQRNLWFRPFFSLVGLIPFLGWLGAGFLFLFYRGGKKTPMDDPMEEKDSRMELLLEKPWQKENRRETILKELDFMPLVDVLEGDDLDLMRGAIEKIARLRTPEAIHILLNYRRSPFPEIRFYITSALTRIKQEMGEELEAAKKQVKNDSQKISHRLYLAKMYLQMIQSGLLDSATKKGYREEALYHLQFVLSSSDASEESYWLLVTLYSSDEKWEEALKVLDQLERKIGALSSEGLKTRIELLFRMKKFGELHKELLRPEILSDPGWRALGAWWTG